MFTNSRVLVFILLQLCAGIAAAAIDAVTEDGRRVRLLDDQTWEFMSEETTDAAKTDAGDSSDGTIEALISITVARKEDRHGNCIYGLRLQNDTGFLIYNLVPQFTAYIESDVNYENVFRGFQRIKPMRSQFQELKFSRIKCDEITRIQVHGGDRCAMDKLTRFSTEKGECLKHVKIIPSTLVNIAK